MENGPHTVEEILAQVDYGVYVDNFRITSYNVCYTKLLRGNGYLDKTNGVLPTTLEEATKKMAQSELACELFGEAFVKNFSLTREWECRQVDHSDPKWELKRYFEII